MRRLAALAACAAILAMLAADTALGALVNGTLPTTGYIYTAVLDNSVSAVAGPITAADLEALERYIAGLSGVQAPTTAQRAALAAYVARLADYQARYAAEIELRAGQGAGVKTTYSLVPPSDGYEAGWHFHNGPVVVTVTAGTLTLVDKSCHEIDVKAGHGYVESPGQVLNALVIPAKNSGIVNVEWFTTRLYPAGGVDPVPVTVPCTP